MQINPKVKVFLAVSGFVLLLIMPVSYAVIREWQTRAAERNNPRPPAADTTAKHP